MSGLDHKTVLVVDESKTQRALLRLWLGARGYSIVEAASGYDAREKMDLVRPDAVILDWELRGISGPDLLRLWSNHELHRWTPVLIVTSHEQIERIHEALELGAVDFLRKPAAEIELYARLRGALRMKEMQDDLLRLASRDSLTDLLNRRVFMERLEFEIARARRYKNPTSLAIIDVDHFKRINDNYGHDVGDEVLRRLAYILRTCARDVDTVARFGGEEFVILTPETPAFGTRVLMERIRQEALGHVWSDSGQPASVTFSAGIAELRGTTDTATALLKAADEALYVAKREGRDRVVSAPFEAREDPEAALEDTDIETVVDAEPIPLTAYAFPGRKRF